MQFPLRCSNDWYLHWFLDFVTFAYPLRFWSFAVHFQQIIYEWNYVRGRKIDQPPVKTREGALCSAYYNLSWLCYYFLGDHLGCPRSEVSGLLDLNLTHQPQKQISSFILNHNRRIYFKRISQNYHNFAIIIQQLEILQF